jgi:OOP family OmpA-OmpF porin
MRVGRELTELGIERALVRGHTDNVGTQEYNLGLSKRRADAVSKVLADGGFSAERIDSKGMGTSMPAADNASAEGRAINRRVVIIVQVI